MPIPHRVLAPLLAVLSLPLAQAASLPVRQLGGGSDPARRMTTAAAMRPNSAGDPSRCSPDGPRIDKRSLRAMTTASSPIPLAPAVAATPPGGPFPLACDDLRFVLGSFGAFGASTAGGDAFFDAGSGEAATVFESMAFIPGIGFLDGDALALPPSAAGATQAGDDVLAEYELGGWRVELRSRLEDCAPGQAVLRQEWLVTNVAAIPQPLAFTLYLDGDLFFRGAADDDFGAAAGDDLFLFDEGAPGVATAYLGLSSEAPGAVRIAREIGEFSEQRRRIARGALVLDRFIRASGAPADQDGDSVTDEGFDASLAIGHDFGSLDPGESRSVVARVRWGVGAIEDIVASPPVVDAGPDRALECEGSLGTVVRLDASSSPSADSIVEWAWSVDGSVLADSAVADVVLFPGRHVVVLEGVDAQGRFATDEAIVEIVDSLPPILAASAPVVLWPPDHRMVPVALSIEARDACSAAVILRPIAVLCDEVGESRRGGDGRSLADSEILPDGTVWLRRERSGAGDGRVYLVVCEAVDEAGNASRAVLRVEVPHDPASPAIDSGAHFAIRP